MQTDSMRNFGIHTIDYGLFHTLLLSHRILSSVSKIFWQKKLLLKSISSDRILLKATERLFAVFDLQGIFIKKIFVRYLKCNWFKFFQKSLFYSKIFPNKTTFFLFSSFFSSIPRWSNRSEISKEKFLHIHKYFGDFSKLDFSIFWESNFKRFCSLRKTLPELNSLFLYLLFDYFLPFFLFWKKLRIHKNLVVSQELQEIIQRNLSLLKFIKIFFMIWCCLLVLVIFLLLLWLFLEL